MDFELAPYLADRREIVNTLLIKILDRFNADRELIQAMHHSLMAGGKRLRPILCLGAADACGQDHQTALPAACAIEMIHTYSLIHDDLPALDNDDLRRGKPTCHKAFNESTAVLAGDALLTHAFNIIALPSPVFSQYPEPESRLDLIGIISAAAGVQGMVEGQMLDMQAEEAGCATTLGHLKTIHGLKTGRLITASVQSGAVSVNATAQQLRQLTAYAEKIGLAFQVVDDILNVEGDPEVMGKAAGSDQLNEKLTFPALIGMDESKRYAKDLIESAIEALSGFSSKADPLRSIAGYIINRKR